MLLPKTDETIELFTPQPPSGTTVEKLVAGVQKEIQLTETNSVISK